MQPDAHQSPDASPLSTVHVSPDVRVIVLCGPIKGDVVEQLRVELVAAIEAGVRELLLDLSQAECISSPVHDLVAAASITLADRGGALLTWSRRHELDDQTYVIADVRDRSLQELVPRPKTSGRTAGGHP